MSEQDPKLESTVLVPVDRVALALFEDDWKARLVQFADVPCTNTEEVEWWTMWRNHTHEALQERDGERKETTGPLYNEFTTINGWYKETGAPAVAFKELANKKLGDFALAQEAAIQAASAAAQLAAEAGDEEAVYEALASIPDVQKTEGSSTFMGWEVDEYDVEEMAKSPMGRMYLTLDTKSVGRVTKTAGSQAHPPVITGVKFKRVASSRPTGKKK